jgi:hypothetical protein
MSNKDQLHHLTHCWYPYRCFFSHFDSILHQMQMKASVTNRNKEQQNSGGHCSNRLFVNLGHGLWVIKTSYTIWHTAGTHTCASSVILTQFFTSGKWRPLWQIGEGTAKQWWTLQQPSLCEFRILIMSNKDQLHHLPHCWYPYMCFFSHFDSILHQWQMNASVTNRNKEQQNSGGHCSYHLFVNLGHGLWVIKTSYTVWHTAGTHTCACSVTLTQFFTRCK